MPLEEEAYFLLSLLRIQRESNVNNLRATHQRVFHPIKVIKSCDSMVTRQLEYLPHWSKSGDSGISHPFLSIGCNCHQNNAHTQVITVPAWVNMSPPQDEQPFPRQTRNVMLKLAAEGRNWQRSAADDLNSKSSWLFYSERSYVSKKELPVLRQSWQAVWEPSDKNSH